jgi:hypothetical protein
VGGDVGGRRPLGKPRFRWKDALLRYTVDLLQIRNWEAARNGKVSKKMIGKAVTRKEGKDLKKSKKAMTPPAPVINKVTVYKILHIFKRNIL